MDVVRPIAFLAPLAALAILLGCGITGPAQYAPMDGAAAVVDMNFTSFKPEILPTRAAQTMQCRNPAIITHNVSVDASNAANPAHASIPACATAFESADLMAGEV